MRSWKRLIYYLILNILISACTTLLVLNIWDRTNTPAQLVQNPPSPVETLILTAAPSVDNTAVVPLIGMTPTTGAVPTDYEAYEVQFGDTLGLVAEKFDVSVESIMEVNQISDPNALPVGMVLYIPVIRETIPSATLTPSPGQPMVVDTTPSPDNDGIDQVLITSVIGVGDLNNEHVFLTRTGTGSLSLAGWRLHDEDNNVFFFPQLEFYTRGGVNIWTKNGSSTPADLFWGLGEPVWRSGERVTLYDANGELRASYTIP